jgi:predicted Fe-Mo cluster-binding NifX family protein
MDKIEIVEMPQSDGKAKSFVIIDRGNGEFTSMPKSTYDEQQALAKAPKVVDEAAVSPSA